MPGPSRWHPPTTGTRMSCCRSVACSSPHGTQRCPGWREGGEVPRRRGPAAPDPSRMSPHGPDTRVASRPRHACHPTTQTCVSSCGPDRHIAPRPDTRVAPRLRHACRPAAPTRVSPRGCRAQSSRLGEPGPRGTGPGQRAHACTREHTRVPAWGGPAYHADQRRHHGPAPLHEGQGPVADHAGHVVHEAVSA